MPPFHLPVEIGPADRSRFQRLIAQMDDTIAYAIFPASVLTMLGIVPLWSQSLQVAGGAGKEVQLAEISVRLEGQERTIVCVFGEPGIRPALGRHTLEAFGLVANETSERLEAARLTMS